jgi:membrane protease YdiL (CAAX protease family)
VQYPLEAAGKHPKMDRDQICYVITAVAAFNLITTANSLGAQVLHAVAASRLLWLASLRIPSFVVCLFLYIGCRPARPMAPPLPTTPWRVVARLGCVWLAVWLFGSTLGAIIAGHWIRYTSGTSAILCFAVVGPLQEELLYRGALYEWAERSWSAEHTWAPVIATTVPFALQHFQFHRYHLSSAALLQVGFALPMGVVFARLRQVSGSIWPGWVVHVLTNLRGIFGGAV